MKNGEQNGVRKQESKHTRKKRRGKMRREETWNEKQKENREKIGKERTKNKAEKENNTKNNWRGCDMTRKSKK